jgi:hypothetical protein
MVIVAGHITVEPQQRETKYGPKRGQISRNWPARSNSQYGNPGSNPGSGALVPPRQRLSPAST